MVDIIKHCPLCRSTRIRPVDHIAAADLVRLYAGIRVPVAAEFAGCEEICLYLCDACGVAFFNPMVTGSEVFYEMLQTDRCYYLEDKNEYNFASRVIKQTDLVLDVGCGKGAFSKKISATNYIGLEFNQSAVNAASENGAPVLRESVQDHAKANPNAYDVVCAFQVLEHVADVRSFVESCIACLKPGGLLIYSTPSADSFARYVPNFALDMPPHHVTRWSDKAFQSLVSFLPVEIVEIWHEPLQLVHKDLYIQTIFCNALFAIFRRRTKPIDFSLSSRFILKVSNLLGHIFVRGLISDDLLPRGISVTAIYRKLA